PQVVIADEPTAHLDSELARELLGILQDLAADGRTILFATHDPLVMNHAMVDRRFDLRDGRLAGEGG
ncbi:MAG: ABC transporter ATP-binding protein, partial [Deltaproteobacteria bacterium]